MNEEKEKMRVERPVYNLLTETEIEEYRKGGWELLTLEPRIQFIVTAGGVMSNHDISYLFEKKISEVIKLA